MLERETILAAFQRLSGLLAERGVIGEISVLGGTAMMLAFQARQTTKDVDVIFAPVCFVAGVGARYEDAQILPRSSYLVDEILEDLQRS